MRLTLTTIFILNLAALPIMAQTPGAPDAAVDAPPPALMKDIGIEQKLDAQIPMDLEFRDEAGKPVKLSALIHDKPVILCLAYYGCPMLCTLVLNGISETCKSLPFVLGKDYQVITVSFNPQEGHELAAEKKANYIKAYAIPGMDTGWHFLTSDEAPVKKLAETVGFSYKYDEATKQYLHASGIMVLTPSGRVSRYFYGIEYPSRDMRLGLVAASEGKIGTPVDKILQLCFHYDPVTGKYSMAIMTLVRAAGIGTMCAIGLFVWAAERAARRKVASPLKSGNA